MAEQEISRKTFKPNEIDLQSIVLIAHNQTTVLDVKHMVHELNVYESIYSKAVKADLVIEDSIGLIERMPLVGDEWCMIKFKTPKYEKAFQMIFRVYKISDRKIETERTHLYAIELVTNEFLAVMKHEINDTWIGKSGDEIVRSVFENYMNSENPENKKRKLVTEKAGNAITLKATMMNPLSVIDYVGGESQATENVHSNYLFFEDHEQFHWTTIKTLLAGETKETFFLVDATKEVSNQRKQFTKSGNPLTHISSIGFASGLDVIRNHTSGFYDNSMDAFDPITKSMSSANFINGRDYNNEKTKTTKLSGFQPFTLNSKYAENTGYSHTRFIVSHLNSGIDYIKSRIEPTESEGVVSYPDDQLWFPRQRHSFAPQKVYESAAMSQIRINITVPGNSDLKAGEIVELLIPQNTSDDFKDFVQSYNLFFGQENRAKFLVTDITHNYKFSEDKYISIIQLAKPDFATHPSNLDAIKADTNIEGF
jgi:hypothetical protein